MPNQQLRGRQNAREGVQNGHHLKDAASAVKILADGGRCPTHPKYAKKRQPRTTCQNCWFLWFLKALTSKELDVVVDTF